MLGSMGLQGENRALKDRMLIWLKELIHSQIIRWQASERSVSSASCHQGECIRVVMLLLIPVNVVQQSMMDVFEVNTVGPLLVAQSFVPLLKKPKSPQVLVRFCSCLSLTEIGSRIIRFSPFSPARCVQPSSFSSCLTQVHRWEVLMTMVPAGRTHTEQARAPAT